MDAFILSSLFVLGLIIGSFLNVVILRFDTGRSISKGRSVCFSCGKTLSWYELLPVASFAMQRGKCRGCKTRISWQYPLIELAAALAFPLAYLKVWSGSFGAALWISFILLAAVLSLYIAITVYDMRHKIIPDLFSYAAAGAAFALAAVGWISSGEFPASKIIAGAALFAFFGAFWLVSKGRWMGLGDAKLALSIGLVLGLSRGAAAVLFSFWIGAIVSLAIMLLQRTGAFKGKLGLKSEIPFGPFILAGFLISFLWGFDMQSILSFLTV